MKMLDETKASRKWLMKVPGAVSNMLQCLPEDFPVSDYYTASLTWAEW